MSSLTWEADKPIENEVEQFLKVEMNLSELFDTVRGFRQDDPLSCNLSNFVMKSVLRKEGMNRNGATFQKSVQLLADADDIDIIVRIKRYAAISAIERECTKMCLAVNEGERRYIYYRQVETRGVFILRLRPIIISLI